MTKQYIKHLYERGMIDDDAKEILLNELIDTVQFDDNSYSVCFNGKSKTLTKKVYELLRFLFNNKGRYYTQEDLIKNVWEKDIVVEPKTINVHICKIKKEFPSIPIKNKKRVGYGWM